jgi:hypothetical protein
MKTNWEGTSHKKKTLNSKIFNLPEGIQRPLYYFNLIFNGVYRLSLISILTLMIVYNQNLLAMEVVFILELVALLLYGLAMMKFLYTRKD